MFDYETAGIRSIAVRSIFLNIFIRCCLFHCTDSLTNTAWRKIQTIDLSDDYKTKNEIGEWLHFCSVASCRFSLRKMFFHTILCMSTVPDDDEVPKFADYFCETYIDTNMYLPELWTQTPTTSVMISTQNKCRRNF